MDFSMSPEIEAVREMVSRFMANEVVPVMEDFEKRQEFPRDLIRKAGEAGLYGAVFPESVGGSDMGYTAAVVIIEEMSRQEVRFTSCNNQQGGTCPSAIYLAGTPEQVQKYVPNLLAGKTIGMMSLSETDSGSDALVAMKTFAKRDGDVYRINGQKMWASIANETDVGILIAKTDRNAGAKGVSAFIVEPKKYPGFTAEPIDLLGMSKAFRTNAVFLDDFVVPVENRLGEEGEGAKIIMRALQPGRLNVAAKALGRYQMIQDSIAEMATAIEASRTLVYRAAWAMDNDQPSNRIASIAKYHASQTCKMCADKAQQIFGGYGLAREYRVSWYRVYADMLYNGEGSANVQKILIAEDALGYKQADRHHGKTGLRDMRQTDVAASTR
jgi:alkylation response protein AidB-like acyl-CoA dehydrogenase